MDLERLLRGPIGRLPSGLAERVYRVIRRLPPIRRRIDAELEKMLDAVRERVKPYRDDVATHRRLPSTGLAREDVIATVASLAARERPTWEEGFASGAVYHGDAGHIEFLDEVLALSSQANPLHADVWPSVAKFEAEVVAMTGAMLGSDAAGPVFGTVTSGGTESILLAVKAHRDDARSRRGITRPHMVVPETAHAAFDKAAGYFGVRLERVPVGDDLRADVTAMAAAMTRNTVLVAGSAPSFPHGVIDPISELAAVAASRRSGFHVDACLGGFVLPWAERLGEPVPPFDFRVSGVTSMSVDTHKYGYAPKGTSVVLYRDAVLRRAQYFTATDWPGGLYFSPTIAGSRPGALSAGAWAAMVSIGEDGYLEATTRILEAAARIRGGVEAVPELQLLGDPMWVVAFGSDVVDVYQVMDRMTERGWSLNGLHRPPAVHIAVTLRHTRPGVAERFVEDLGAAVADVATEPRPSEGMAPVYGLAARLPARSAVGDVLERYIDLLYEV